MKKNEMKRAKSDQGFTMIELIIVIAIIGILSAVLVPSFVSMSRKSKLRADVSTIKQLQTQMDLYMTENDGAFPSTATPPVDPAENSKDELPTTAVAKLVVDKYIKASDTVESKEEKIRVQSKNAKVIYNAAKEHLELKVKDNELKEANKMAEADKEWLDLTPEIPETPETP